MLMRPTHPFLFLASLAIVLVVALIGHAGFISSGHDLHKHVKSRERDDSHDHDSFWLGAPGFPHFWKFSDEAESISHHGRSHKHERGHSSHSSHDHDGLSLNGGRTGRHEYDLKDACTDKSFGHDKDDRSERCDSNSDRDENDGPPPCPGPVSNTPEPPSLLLAGVALASLAGVALRRRLARA
jgi:hypothetical protein